MQSSKTPNNYFTGAEDAVASDDESVSSGGSDSAASNTSLKRPSMRGKLAADSDDSEDDIRDDASNNSDSVDDNSDIFDNNDADPDIMPGSDRPGFDELSDSDDDGDYNEDYLKKLSHGINRNAIEEHHPEIVVHNTEEVDAMCKTVRDERGRIIDPLHRTMPFISKYERARVIGERSKQLNAGAKSMVPVDPSVIDGYLIALKEFADKKIPFIIRRPLPNGGVEYWRLEDLEIL
jgi:DNA-directed RNA polymerase I, II, and III subunit RPABC2